jgi:hypothetical protein
MVRLLAQQVVVTLHPILEERQERQLSQQEPLAMLAQYAALSGGEAYPDLDLDFLPGPPAAMPACRGSRSQAV